MKENYCNNQNSPFLGQAYWAKSDPTMVLLYDVNGYIAGIQTFAPASQYTPPKKSQGSSIVLYGDYWVLTAYFVDPSIICTTGRTAAQYASQGTGQGLWIQNGTTPLTSTIQIPLDQNAVSSTMWTQGKCFYTMGQHYWYNLSPNMDCNDFFPYCILYNSGKLDAFCFALNGDLDDAAYDYPHPTPSVLSQFMNPVPQCMNDDNPPFNKYSTIHIYMTNWPRSTSFC
jgi:charged multivesicular body protein 7